MNPLDEALDNIDESTVSPQPTAMRYGLLWGLVSILVGLTSHLLGWSDPMSPSSMSFLVGLIAIGINILFIVLALKHHRDNELGGYMSFGRGFKTGMLTTLVYAIIATVWFVIFFSFIYTDMFEVMDAAMVEEWERQGLNEDQIDEARGLAGWITSPVPMTLLTLAGALFYGALISLIASALMKRIAPGIHG